MKNGFGLKMQVYYTMVYLKISFFCLHFQDKRKLFSADEEGRQSKWTAFLEPEEELGEEKEAEDEETYTTSRTEFQQAYRRMKQDKRGAK